MQHEVEHLSLEWHTALENSPFDDEGAFRLALLNEQEKQHLSRLKQQLTIQLERSLALEEQARESLDRIHGAEHAKLWSQLPMAEVQQQLVALGQQLDALRDQQTELRVSLKHDRQLRQQQANLLERMAQQQLEYDDLSYLNALIGSKNGDAFRKFAQGLTLDHLVHLANRQLHKLHSRYQLQRKATGVLELEVLDLWQGDEVRDTRTLSGGESFLVSLALALGLSDLVSHKTSIESLFLDEGFGTLDSETLDTALNALDNLNASGKMIGVISHIEAMKERIPVQIRVKKSNGLGVSRLAAEYAISS
ncbi:SbcC/MukB-like Walker B domain-containing protein [Dongshaea marina]|uniref:SbcC/MukB-like Walker B domain-containing protein n=1 Tax=Dongshaea marina TaxID=2047966 RepID=UPI000D3EBB4B|nr:SbcC/MukB-like Walker B domain-containing protein [Dongshaea marina]